MAASISLVVNGTTTAATRVFSQHQSSPSFASVFGWAADKAKTAARDMARKYAGASTTHPHLTAGLTSSILMAGADAACQSLFQPGPSYDTQRTASLAAFGFLYYGGPCKLLYLSFDRIFGATSTVFSVGAKTVIDCFVHTPFSVVPSFYLFTNAVKGLPLDESLAQLEREWRVASIGSAAYWTPIQALNFALVPQHGKILYVSAMSFIHKSWLSFISNRDRHARRNAPVIEDDNNNTPGGVSHESVAHSVVTTATTTPTRDASPSSGVAPVAAATTSNKDG